VRYSPGPEVGGACEAARLRASLAIDGELDDDLDQLLLKRHLDRCPECVDAVARLEAAAWLLRSEPAESHRCDVRAPRRAARRLPWANIAVAMLTLAVGTMTLPHGSEQAGSRSDEPRLAAPPPRLPIGQRSAGEDFRPHGPTRSPHTTSQS
jgi:hypothetical protein